MKQASKSLHRKKEKWNFKPYLIIAAIILIIIAVAAVIYFTSDAAQNKVLKFTYQNGEYYDEKNDITYVVAPFYYQSQLMTSSDYPYAESNLFTLYRVGYRDEDGQVNLIGGNLWLSTSKDVGAQLYYNPDKVDLPELHEYEGDTIYICEPDGSTFFSTTALKGAETEALLDAFIEAEGSDFDTLYSQCELIANLKVGSSKYKWLWLNLWLFTDAEGNYYLYEEVTHKFLETDAQLFAPYFEEAETDTETEAS